MKTVSVVGSTGSIGTQTIDVIRANPERFQLDAIGGHSSVDLLVEQANEFHPRIVAINDENRAAELKERLPHDIELRAGADALTSIATESDIILNSVVGFAGLPVTLAALNAGKRLALANKESLIAAGPLVKIAKQTSGAELLPVDSEHGALHQAMRAGTQREINKFVVTASGGPFRGKTRQELENVTREQALNHPTWKMGPKITIDSSTLFNKGLEVIEAHEFFDLDYDKIEVVVHPESIIHSAVEFSDGSTIAQLSVPDMRLPIGYALGYPDRLATPYGSLNLASYSALHFEAPDLETFRCLALAYEAGRTGGTAPTWLNAANEVAVAGFLAAKVTWLQISSIIEQVLSEHDGASPDSLEAVIDADGQARRRAEAILQQGF